MYVKDIDLIKELRDKADEICLEESKMTELLRKAADRLVWFNKQDEADNHGFIGCR